MSVLNPPADPAADNAAVRDEWVRAVDQLVTQVEGWCKARDWPTRRIPKRINEPPLGEYEVPALVFQVDFLKLMLEPDARFAAGCRGVASLYRMPEYSDVARVLRGPAGWEYLADVPPGRLPPGHPPADPGRVLVEVRRPFDEAAFLYLVGLMT
jgi:hypothetical protein